MNYVDFRCRIANYTSQKFDVIKLLEGIYDPRYDKKISAEYNDYVVGGYRLFRDEYLDKVCVEEIKKLMDEVVYNLVQEYCMAEFVLGIGGAGANGEGGLPPISIDLTEYWVNVMPPGSYQRIHSHYNSNLSGTILLQAPEGSGDLYIPSPYINGIENIITTHQEYVMFPRASEGILYPSSLPHYVSRNESDEDRVSISYNLKLKNI